MSGIVKRRLATVAKAVDQPAHYQGAGGLTAVDVIESYGLSVSWHMADAAKYLLRCGRKGARVEDLAKARWYLCRLADDAALVRGLTLRRAAPVPRSPIAAVLDGFGIHGHRGVALAELLRIGLRVDASPYDVAAALRRVVAAIDAAIAGDGEPDRATSDGGVA